jgi:hypothetical protein
MMWVELLELAMYVLVALVVWLVCAIALAKIEEGEARDAQRDRAARGMPAADVTGTGRVAGQPSQAENPRPATLRLYKDVEHDHRDYGDEDPAPYGLGTEERPRVARPKREHVKSRRDGIQLSDESQAALLRSIFGEST